MKAAGDQNLRACLALNAALNPVSSSGGETVGVGNVPTQDVTITGQL